MRKNGWKRHGCLKKKKEGSETRNEATLKPGKAGKGVLARPSRRNSALWTLGYWPTDTLVRLLAYRTEQSKSVLSLQHQQDLQTVLPQGTEERALLSRGNCEKRLCQETLLGRKGQNLRCCKRK